MMEVENLDNLIITESERNKLEEIIEKIASLKNIYNMVKDNSSAIEFNINIESLENEIKEEQASYNEWWDDIYIKYNLDINEKYILMFEECTLKNKNVANI
ncbi:CXXX repeat peptide modification system protein [Clostridium botulinum]|nr:CXXX repeat peptide modification system protein [Clostridium botulinum]MCS4523427.1 CXXX repeat peptide modification system protein [Clostridium botulinum]